MPADRGTVGWWRDIANHVEDIAVDLAEMHVDDPLTPGQMQRVEGLLAEMRRMTETIDDEHDAQVFPPTENLPPHIYQAVVISRRKAPSLIIEDDTPPAEQTKRIDYDGGLVTDVAISCDLFRMERMDKGAWWAAACRGEQKTMFSLVWDRKRREIVAIVTEDTIPPVEGADA